MARKRMIWRDALNDPDLGRCDDAEWRLWIGLILLADDEGRGLADPPFLRANIWPYHNRSKKWVEGKLKSLENKMGSLELYEANGRIHYALLKWSEYQTIRKELFRQSKIPPPSVQKRNANVTITARQRNASASIE